MTSKPKKPFVPAEKHETIRHEIAARITGQPLSAHALSAGVHLPEKEICGHLEHIRTALRSTGSRLLVTPALCRACGFEFRKRERLTKPGKCPVCGSSQIESPLFSIG